MLTGGTMVVIGGSVVVVVELVVVLDVDVYRAEVLVPPPLHAANDVTIASTDAAKPRVIS